MMMIAATLGMLGAPVETSPEPHPVIELRQYKIVAGQRDRFIDLFEREFIETQEAEGMELIGQFRDRSDPDRFTWIRAFPDMEGRQSALAAFYSGPAWQAHRGTANPMLVDNDNVLLLRLAWPGSGFGAGSQTALPSGPSGLAIVTIHYLWKRPDEGFTRFFKDQMVPALARAGLAVEAAMVREESPNNFPRLPVREGEKLFLWVTQADSEAAWIAALARLKQDAAWPVIVRQLFQLEERPAQRLLLDPTPRSKLR